MKWPWKKWLALFVSSGAFSGFLPGWITGKSGAGGGLMGSILAFLIQLAFLLFTIKVEYLILGGICLFIFSFSTIPVAEEFMREKWGKRKRHTGKLTDHDFNETNVDEIIGQLIAGLPVFLSVGSGLSLEVKIAVLVGAFVAFRFLDVTKILGIRWVEKALFKGGCLTAGIILDDVLAGAYVMLLGVAVCLWVL